MFRVEFEYYKNDYDKFFETRNFCTIEELGQFLVRANADRDKTPRDSKYWKSPITTSVNEINAHKGMFRTRRETNEYALWLKKVTYNKDIVVFEESQYCSPKFYEFLNDLDEQISKPIIYGEF